MFPRGNHVASIERRSGRYRVKYRDPIGRQRSRTFTRKADADRFAVEMEADLARGQWLDPTGAQVPVAEWAETFLSLCRRLEHTSRATYERDLRRYVLPRFGDYRIGSVPAEDIENWLNDELDAGIAPSSVHRHYRPLRRMFQVAIDKQKIVANPCDRVTPRGCRRRRWCSSTGTRSSNWPPPTTGGSRRSSCSPSRRACAGANWSASVEVGSTCAPSGSGSPNS